MIVFLCLNLRINESLIKFKRSTRDRLDRKLFKLGCKLDLNAGGHPNAVINLSSYQPKDREKYLLSFGLDFQLPNFNLKFCNYFLPFEKLYKRLEPEISNQTMKHKFLTEIRTLAHKYYFKFNRNKMYSPIFSKNDI